MEILREADFRKEIKSSPRAAYLFYGDEDYMKKFALDTAIQAISPDPSFAFFNEIRIDSFTYSPEALIDAFMPAPMMADRKLIILTGIDFNAMRQNEIDDFCEALESAGEYDYNTLIIVTGADRFDGGNNIKRPTPLLVRLAEYVTPVFFEKNSPAKLVAWVGKHIEHNGATASPEVCALIIERCGRDMFNLATETDKLAFFVLSHGRSEVTRDDVINVAVPVAEFDTFALSNAIGARRRDEALEILADMKRRRLDPIIIFSEINKTVSDMLSIALLRADGLTQLEISTTLSMNDFRVGKVMQTLPDLDMCRRMLQRCNEADREIKSWGDGFAALEKLICTI